jgi:hypothetical protein
MEGQEPRFTMQATLSTNTVESIGRSPKPSCYNQLVAIENGITQVSEVVIAVKKKITSPVKISTFHIGRSVMKELSSRLDASTC